MFTIFYSTPKRSLWEHVKGAYFWHSEDNSSKSHLVTSSSKVNSSYLYNSISLEHCFLSQLPWWGIFCFCYFFFSLQCFSLALVVVALCDHNLKMRCREKNVFHGHVLEIFLWVNILEVTDHSFNGGIQVVVQTGSVWWSVECEV